MSNKPLYKNPDFISLLVKALFIFPIACYALLSGINGLTSGEIEVYKKGFSYVAKATDFDSSQFTQQVWFRIVLGLLLFLYPLRLVKFLLLQPEQRESYLKKVRYTGPKSWKVPFLLTFIVLSAVFIFIISEALK